jgi:class I fructose-bisphosphate aldolase
VRRIAQSAFNGRRILIFSAGVFETDDRLLGEVRAIQVGGSIGSIIGPNALQRPKADAVRLLRSIMEVYRGV